MPSFHERLRDLIQEYSPTICPQENTIWGQTALDLDKAYHAAMARREAYHKARNAARENQGPDEEAIHALRAYTAALREFDLAEQHEQAAFFRCAYFVTKSLAREAAGEITIPPEARHG